MLSVVWGERERVSESGGWREGDGENTNNNNNSAFILGGTFQDTNKDA